MAEASSKTVNSVIPAPSGGFTTGQWTTLVFVKGTTAANNDVLTVTGLTTVIGAFLVSSTGVVGTLTFATNVITITNGSTLVWSGLAWGT